MMAHKKLPQLYTSRWANKDLADLDVVLVGISRGIPRWPLSYRYRLLRLLAPTRETFGKGTDDFAEQYVARLEEIGLEKIVSDLARIGEKNRDRPLVLLCWEKPSEFCHRHVLGDWIQENVGVEVPELVPGMIAAESGVRQERLF